MRYLSGSRYFFQNYYPDFNSDTDYDYDEWVAPFKNEPHRVYNMISEPKIDVFQMPLVSKEDLIKKSVRCPLGMHICAFLNPDFISKVDFTIEDLKKLEPLAKRSVGHHYYLQMIYYFYLENNAFILTDEQRLLAYNSYKETRPRRYKN